MKPKFNSSTGIHYYINTEDWSSATWYTQKSPSKHFITTEALIHLLRRRNSRKNFREREFEGVSLSKLTSVDILSRLWSKITFLLTSNIITKYSLNRSQTGQQKELLTSNSVFNQLWEIAICHHPLTSPLWDWREPIPKKGNTKEFSNYGTVALISHASKIMLKILKARLRQYLNCKLPNVQAGFRKGRGTRDQIANIHWIIEKARQSQKNTYFCCTDYAKHLFLLYWLCQSLWLCESQQTLGNSERDGNIRPPDLPLEKPVCRLGSKS